MYRYARSRSHGGRRALMDNGVYPCGTTDTDAAQVRRHFSHADLQLFSPPFRRVSPKQREISRSVAVGRSLTQKYSIFTLDKVLGPPWGID